MKYEIKVYKNSKEDENGEMIHGELVLTDVGECETQGEAYMRMTNDLVYNNGNECTITFLEEEES